MEKLKLPLVSVIIPTYNYAHFLGPCIESALNQNYPNIEVMVVDDGSTDETAEVVARYPGVRYLYQPHVGNGTNRAINHGIRKAHGDFIAWLSSDDRFVPEKTAKQVNALLEAQAQDPRVIMAYSNVIAAATDEIGLRYHPHPSEAHLQELLEKGRVQWEARFAEYHPDTALATMLAKNFINGCTTLIDRRIFDSIGLFDEAMPRTGDVEMWIRMLTAGYRFCFVPEPLTINQIHGSNTSTWNESYSEYNLIRRKIQDRYSIEQIYPALKEADPLASRDAHLKLGDIMFQWGCFDTAVLAYSRASLGDHDPRLASVITALPTKDNLTPLVLPTSKSTRIVMGFDEKSDVARCHLVLSHYLQAFEPEDDVCLVVWIPSDSEEVLEAFSRRFEAVCAALGVDPETTPHAEVLLMVEPIGNRSYSYRSQLFKACQIFLPLGSPNDSPLLALARRAGLSIAYEATPSGLLTTVMAWNPVAVATGWKRLHLSV